MDTQPENIETDIDTLDELPVASKPKLYSPPGKFKRFITSKWTWIIFSLLLASVVAAWFIQPSRLWLVNKLGVRAPVTVVTRTVAEPGHPSALLKNTTTIINGATHTTNDQGVVQTTVAYGSQTIEATKQGYESVTQTDFYDFDPFFGKLGITTPPPVELQLKSTGVEVTFTVVDWLTNQPLTIGQFAAADVMVAPNAQGVVSFKAPPTDSNVITIKTNFSGAYIDREFSVQLHGAPPTEVFVPAGKVYYVHQQAVWRSNIDGGEAQQFMAASNDARFAVSPTGTYGALTAQGKLSIVTMATAKLTEIDTGSGFRFIDWAGDRLVYVVGGSKQRLASVDAKQAQKVDIAQAATFENIHVSVGRAVYMAHLAPDQADAANTPVLRTAKIEGGTEQTLGTKITALTQQEPELFAYQTANNTWGTYNANTGLVATAAAPKNLGRTFLYNPANQLRLGVERQDGTTTIFTKSIATNEEKILHNVAGVNGPVYWVGGVIIYGHGGALYALSAQGGEPKKTTTAILPSDSSFHFY